MYDERALSLKLHLALTTISFRTLSSSPSPSSLESEIKVLSVLSLHFSCKKEIATPRNFAATLREICRAPLRLAGPDGALSKPQNCRPSEHSRPNQKIYHTSRRRQPPTLSRLSGTNSPESIVIFIVMTLRRDCGGCLLLLSLSSIHRPNQDLMPHLQC